jgi:hypothetical protein
MADVRAERKQLLRAAALDERAYGFGGLMDLLRACQRESLVRLERDRRGGLRVFQGPNLGRGPMAPAAPAEPIFDIANELEETQESPIVVVEDQPAAAASRARGSRKSAARKPAGTRARRGSRKKEKDPEAS